MRLPPARRGAGLPAGGAGRVQAGIRDPPGDRRGRGRGRGVRLKVVGSYDPSYQVEGATSRTWRCPTGRAGRCGRRRERQALPLRPGFDSARVVAADESSGADPRPAVQGLGLAATTLQQQYEALPDGADAHSRARQRARHPAADRDRFGGGDADSRSRFVAAGREIGSAAVATAAATRSSPSPWRRWSRPSPAWCSACCLRAARLGLVQLLGDTAAQAHLSGATAAGGGPGGVVRAADAGRRLPWRVVRGPPGGAARPVHRLARL